MVSPGGPGGFMPPKHIVAEKNKEPLPKNIKEVPGFLVMRPLSSRQTKKQKLY